MAKKLISEKPEPKDNLLQKSKTPLVFISHDTRDAEIAEEFSHLLRSASAGVLKSFRSSDKKGTQGIEYGTEWYPVIMDKIDEATDVVCLLTKHSVDRPWILYEAGVAKGKLGIKVLGIALGIPLAEATKGPFAQFQNCDDDTNSLTKLVFELVKRIEGADPDEQTVQAQVETFKKKITEILTKIPKEENKKENVAENSVAKLFEEIKIMFQDLPSRIENRVDPEYRRKRGRIHPMMMEELFHLNKKVGSHIPILMALSIFKNDFPWIYEIGNETIKVMKSRKSAEDKKTAVMDFLRIFEFTFRHPMMREMNIISKESQMNFRDGMEIFERYFNMYLLDKEFD